MSSSISNANMVNNTRNDRNNIRVNNKSESISSSLPRITKVIFDLDGLILDTEFTYERAAQCIVERYGREFVLEDRLKILGRPGAVVAKMIVEDLNLPITADEFMKQFDHEYHRIVNEQPVPLMPGAERLIRHLHDSMIPMAIATGSRRFMFELNTKFHRKLFDLFNHVLMTPEDPEVERGKPDPQPYLVCAKRFDRNTFSSTNNYSLNNNNNNNESILVFEDSLIGIESANRAGMTTVWVPDYRIDYRKKLAEQFESFDTESAAIDKRYRKPHLIIDSLKLFQPELFGLPPYPPNDDK